MNIENQLQEAVKTAHAEKTALEIVGGGTKRFYGEQPTGTSLSVSEHSGVVEYYPDELIITVRAGTKFSELEQILAEQNQQVPFDPPRFGEDSTIGGMVASGLSGVARPWRGSLRDHLLYVKLLDGAGQILEFGGQVVKNVAGYDLFRLMSGALGTMGVLLEVSLRLRARPETRYTFSLETESSKAAIEMMNKLSRTPLPITGLFYHQNKLNLRLSGREVVLEKLADGLSHDFGLKQDEIQKMSEVSATLNRWEQLRDHQLGFFQAAIQQKIPLWRLSLPANTQLPEDVSDNLLLDWGGSQLWWKTDRPAAEIRAFAKQSGGFATLFRVPDELEKNRQNVFQPLPEQIFSVHQKLKQQFDPAGILNPGRLYPDL